MGDSNMNKNGGSLMIWGEVIIFLILFLGAMTFIGRDMNTKYGKTNDLTLGLNLSTQQGTEYLVRVYLLPY
jgi:hypothetical protein